MLRTLTRAGTVAGLLLLGAVQGRAAETETRTYSVTVDGKPAGTHTITLRAADDGTHTVTAATDVRVRIAIKTYTYTLRSTEVWKADKLVSIDAYTNDDGKRYQVKAAAGPDGLTVTANGVARTAAAAAVTTTGWKLPDPKAKDVTVIDTENGSVTPARLDALGPVQVAVNGQVATGQRYKLTGVKLDAEWWLDPAGRLVRQAVVSDGHRIVLTLTGVAR